MKLDQYTNLASNEIGATTKLVALNGATPINKNVPITNLIQDNFLSSSPYLALSAKKGKELSENKLDIPVNLSFVYPFCKDGMDLNWIAPVDNLTSTTDDGCLSANQGRVLNENKLDKLNSIDYIGNGMHPLVLADLGRILIFNIDDANDSGVSMYSENLPIGFNVKIINLFNTGQIKLFGDQGKVVHCANGLVDEGIIINSWSLCELIKINTNDWMLIGDTQAL